MILIHVRGGIVEQVSYAPPEMTVHEGVVILDADVEGDDGVVTMDLDGDEVFVQELPRGLADPVLVDRVVKHLEDREHWGEIERDADGRPVSMRCESCGTVVELGRFTATCSKCGVDYNWTGTRLAPREQWGAETGETAADILRIE